MTTKHAKHQKLSQILATAICGNDILSSCLYVSGIAILFAGVYGPLVLLGIGIVLALYRMVYIEVVEALPINGGAYNCLLNGTSKTVAAVAGVMTFLSYVATAVLSAKVGVEYLNIGFEKLTPLLFGHVLSMPVLQVTIGVLFAFALLVIMGVKDSAYVATGIFILHICTLVIFLGAAALYVYNHGIPVWGDNMLKTTELFTKNGGWKTTVYLAFSACLLGVSGFESSANFVEEQQKGVFRKTLRNMLVGVVIFNPLIALAVVATVPYEMVVSAKDFLLADAASLIGGTFLQSLVVVDAFLVLSGAVLTSYVGVSGLLHRMTGDNCLPSFFGKENSHGSFPRIVLGFFLLCSSILWRTGGDLLSLAGVYAIAFLGVMSMFALGNLILKESRTELKRTYRAPIIVVLLAFFATALGMLGNIRIDPQNLVFFELYFFPTLAIILFVIYIDYFFKFLLRITRGRFPYLHKYISLHFRDITEGRFAAFIHHPSRMHQILNYIDRNETGWNITLVHCKSDDPEMNSRDLSKEIAGLLPKLREAGFYPHFNITQLYVDKEFGPEAIEEVEKKLNIRRNRMLIGAIHESHNFDYDDLGGVRIIFG